MFTVRYLFARDDRRLAREFVIHLHAYAAVGNLGKLEELLLLPRQMELS